MSDSKNLMGLNLSVDNNLIADAAREAIISGIAATMSNRDAIVNEFVKAILTERVLTEDGSKPRGYSSEKTCSRMEFVVRKAISGAVKEEILVAVEGIKPEIRKMIRRKFEDAETQNSIVDMLFDSLRGSLTNNYRTTINVDFDRIEDQY